MYSGSHLDSPPPSSQFRRPWSPDPYEPLPSSLNSRYNHGHGAMDSYPSDDELESYRQQRLDASDVSVDALDLTEYARTLPRQHSNTHNSLESYPLPPLPLRQLTNRDSLPQISPALRRETLSSGVRTASPGPQNHVHRPFSLPPSSQHHTSVSRERITFPMPILNHSPQLQGDPEIDIAQFPAWSRNWYEPENAKRSSPNTHMDLPTTYLGNKGSPFDPGYIHGEGAEFQTSSDPYAPTSFGHESTRDLLPWNDSLEQGISSTVKEERVRMLEREFGPNAKGKSQAKDLDFMDENGKPLIGTVNAKGQLITQGPTKRAAMRVLQILLALTAAIPSIYAAVTIKPKETPPPAGKPAAYILYILSILNVLLFFYLFFVRPCCTGKRQKGPKSGTQFANGMIVLPVQGPPGGKKDKKSKKGKRGKSGGGMGDVHINLIVDPSMFDRNNEKGEEGSDEEEAIPGSYEPGDQPVRKKRAKRRSVFAGLAMEAEWKQARAWLKKLTAIDVAGVLSWGTCFVFILIGQRCPSGSFEGWCNAYNVSSAAACLLCVAFGISVFFDIKDLHTSKISPRIRT